MYCALFYRGTAGSH